ncbi:SDR family NAD(P)-dependent oxidoreductase [Rhizobiales bacterium L72]|uniref:SDR family NAD(P)-dependent oxidoreductase n=1 Tax=Propylenella binzhouense TaxID=2555902 RepID=A0A964WRT9_9HYPH|nr:SDR family oxidoreductase [Propylenella binzhouense]MYZ46264.1 SDR family NAD(P)-dependent oxidoreductase [Propylenella binzhouense]
MSRILVLGGYGGFGARLARRLVGRGHSVLAAGRNPQKAAALEAACANLRAVAADRNGDLLPVLAAHRPDLVIDAAGPFQGSGYQVPLACIAAGIPYVDLADARAFVCGIGTLDEAARRAGVAVVSGASSVPALSGAAARRLAEGMESVRTVDIAISASSRATAGASVARAVLSYAGKPVKLWRARQWTEGRGWQELGRETFVVPERPPLRNRWLALADVPDLELLPAMLPGRPAVTFRAGTESPFQTLGLWGLAWAVRLGAVSSAERFAPLLLRLQRLTQGPSDGRSAMSVRVSGLAGGAAVERRWTLLAEDGDGPEIPTLAAVLLAEAIAAGRVPAGARHASALLPLEAFDPLFATLSVAHGVDEADLPPPLYRRIMGARFDALPPLVRELHEVHRDGGASGEGEVVRGGSPVAGLIARMMRFPPAGRHKLHVAFRESGGIETWTRDFGGHRFRSRLGVRAGHLVERFGPLRFHFELPSDGAGLRMEMRSWSAFGIPLPMALAPQSLAREWQEGDRFRFEVPVSLPLVGLVVRYTGWLRPD